MCPSLIQIGSKTAEKNSAQTNKQTDTTKIMVTWPWTKNWITSDFSGPGRAVGAYWVMSWWRCYLSGVRCKWFALHMVQLMSLPPRHLLLRQDPD